MNEEDVLRELRRSLDEALELLDTLWPDKLLLREVLGRGPEHA